MAQHRFREKSRRFDGVTPLARVIFESIKSATKIPPNKSKPLSTALPAGEWMEALECRLFLSTAQPLSLADLPVAAQQAISKEGAKLTASDGAGSEFFGSVSISGNTIVVGADEGGAAYVFTDSGSAWTQTAELTPSDGAGLDGFGNTVSISGNTVVVGAAEATVGGNSEQGEAYVFTEPASGWANMTQTAKLTVSDGAAGDFFGDSVSISGNTVVVGAQYATATGNNPGPGAAYVFTGSDSDWTQTAKLTASDGVPGDLFGFSVSISGSAVVVGAAGATATSNAMGPGAAYVFTESGSDWIQNAKLTESHGAAYDFFGGSVSISGNTVVVGAYNATVGRNSQQGAAYVFTESGTDWPQVAKLTASDGKAGDVFGFSVSISGNTVVVGAETDSASDGPEYGPGAAYVFTERSAGWADMTQTAELTAPDGVPGDDLGYSVSISGNTVVAGAPNATVAGNVDQGAAYVFGAATSSGGGGSSTGLTPSIVADTVPLNAVSGQTLHGSLKVKLADSVSTPEKGFTVKVYASTNATLGASGNTLVTSVSKGTAVQPGKSTSLAIPIKDLPSSLQDGSYYLIVETVDSAGNTAFVASISTVAVAAPLVQPVVSVGAFTPGVVGLNKTGSVVVTVTNRGNVPASGVNITLSVSEDGVTPVAEVVLASTRSGVRILPNKNKTFKLHFKVTSALMAGNYYPYLSVSLDGVSTTGVGRTQFTIE